MTQINSTELKEIYQDAIEKDEDFKRKLLKHVLKQVLEIFGFTF